MFEDIDVSELGKGKTIGTMIGTVKNRYTGVGWDFHATWIWRDELHGLMRFHGTVDDLEGPDVTGLVGLELYPKESGPGIYHIGGNRIDGKTYKLALTYKRFDRKNGTSRTYKGTEGEVVLTRGHPEKRISGTLTFKTESWSFHNYEVKLEFDIPGMSSKNLPPDPAPSQPR